MTKVTIAAQLARLRKEREALEKKEKALLAKTNDKVLTKIVAMVKDAGLTAADVSKALAEASGRKTTAKGTRATTRKSALAGKKVAPKYRNPANPEQTWTGRGVSPAWVQALKSENKLESALIQN